jgi:hypothetical protein
MLIRGATKIEIRRHATYPQLNAALGMPKIANATQMAPRVITATFEYSKATFLCITGKNYLDLT